jgi:ketosteroid isomerase-like protein
MEPTVESLVGRSDEWDRAVQQRDVHGVLDYIDDDFSLTLVMPTPATVSRASWLATLPDYVVHAWEAEEQLVHVQGETGAILQRIRMEATVLGEDRSRIFVVSDVWRHVDGQWRVWRRHSTPLTAGPMPGSD